MSTETIDEFLARVSYPGYEWRNGQVHTFVADTDSDYPYGQSMVAVDLPKWMRFAE